jgi:DNA-binding GntR family transcriptional regulator
VPSSGTERDARARATGRGSSRNAERLRASDAAGSTDQVVGGILQGLYRGRYVPGQRLVEADLMRIYGVGRGSVREALQRLAAEGVVTIDRHRGASIRALSRQDALDLLEVVGALASLAARRAAESAGSADGVRSLRDAQSAFAEAAAGWGLFEFGHPRTSFYAALAQMSGNQELIRLLSSIHIHLIRVQFHSAFDGAALARQVDEYQKVVDAVLAGDGAGAERAVRRQVRRIAKSIQLMPDEDCIF